MAGAPGRLLATSWAPYQSDFPAERSVGSCSGGVQVLGSSCEKAAAGNAMAPSVVTKLKARTRNPLERPSERLNRKRTALAPAVTAPDGRGRVSLSVAKPPPIPP